jgi:hypothetical protein
MKKMLVILGMVVTIVGFTALNAHANFTLNFDENGNATGVDVSGAPFSVSGVLGTSPDGFTNALSYGLPELVTTGPVSILDPDGSISDFLIFGIGETGSSTQTMWFYSGPGLDLADLSATDWATALSLYSNAPVGATEAADGTFTYIAGGPNTYNGTSGAVPEPSTILLLCAGLAGVGLLRKRFKG